LLQSLIRLWDARQVRLLTADCAVPAVVWIVTIVGGALTVAFAGLMGAPSLGMHLAMFAALAISEALVLVLIVALSNPFRVSTYPFDQVLGGSRHRPISRHPVIVRDIQAAVLPSCGRAPSKSGMVNSSAD